jgi:hypothetical protein
MNIFSSLCVSLVVISVLASQPALGQDKLEYNRDIRPILAENCFACHGPDSAARKANLRLDVRESAIDSKAIIPNDADRSSVIDRIFTDDEDEVMPPPEMKKHLSEDQKELLEKWIEQGAEYEPHWSFIPPAKAELPNSTESDWPINAVDHFVLEKLIANDMDPQVDTEPTKLFRRLHLDITGLPPKPADVAAFVDDYQADSESAMSNWIDQLMAKKSWGEHRARYWLDAARYADTHGLHFDNYREMWPYRDWVIRSFNTNQPFDQFTVEQIAGDLLENPTDDQLIATGFQRCNITTNEGGTIADENLALYASDRVQTFGWVYLGLTTNCCQCHDHKFDPTSMKDYYSLAAYFRNTTQPALDGNVKDGRGPVLTVPAESDAERWNVLPGEIEATKAQQNERNAASSDEFEAWLASLDKDSLSQTPSTEQLAIHVPLTEGEGNEVKSAGDEPLTFQSDGKLKWTPDGRTGPAPFPNQNTSIPIGDVADYEQDQSFSLGAWAKPKKLGDGAILARMENANDYRGWDLWVSNNAYSFHLIDLWPSNGIKVSTPANTVKPGQWQHVFATYDGSGTPQGIKIYINGVSQKLTVNTNTLKPKASIRTRVPTRIGRRSDNYAFNGAIQDVRIYDRLLNGKEISAIAKSGPVQNWLATEEAERTPDQKKGLKDHYLANEDKPYMKISEELTKLEQELIEIRKRSPITHIQKERMDRMPMANILLRGEYDNVGDEVKAATPEFLHPTPDDAPANRLGLAQWTVDPANPLTARVTVNRFWQEIFGRGLVVTPEDFGVMGALPSHPKLLDWLAVDFRENNWDVKRLFKTILMSRTYRQSAATTPEKTEKDPGNALLSRGPRFRMDAEMIRDYALNVSGLMSRKMYGPSVKPYQPEGLWDIVGLPGGDTRNFVQSKDADLYRRTIYTFRKRMSPPPNLEAFNSPSREFCTVKRERTNTPLQALVTLNDPQFVEAARNLATRALKAKKPSIQAMLQWLAMETLGRKLVAIETDILTEELVKFTRYYSEHAEDAKALINFGDSDPDDQLDAQELAAWTMICNQLLNLDELLSK